MMNLSLPSHRNDEEKSAHYTSRRVTRIELIVCIMAFPLLVLISDKIGKLQYSHPTFATTSDLNNMEQTVSSLRTTVDNLIHRNSELSDKIIQMEHHLSQASETKVKDINQQAVAVKAEKQLSVDEHHRHYDVRLADKPRDKNPLQVNNIDHANRKKRKLESDHVESTLVLSDSNIFSRNTDRRCSEAPILSPLNHLNNFTYDEKVDRMLDVIQTLSSMEALRNNNSPQYRAACWILFDDKLKVNTTDELFMQRYVIAVFLHTIFPNGHMLVPMHICEYEKLECDDEGHVTKIEMGNLLTGNDSIPRTIPSEISHLRFLERLDISDNQLVGTIPPELGRLSNLQYLNLDLNDLTGSVPSKLGRLINLKELLLGKNNLDGTIPSEIGHCTLLENIHFTDNQFKGTIPKELFNCTQLEVLDLDINDLTGTIPTEIKQTPKLRKIQLKGNKLSGSIPSQIGTLTSLKEIWLGSNDLRGSLPREIENIGTLEWLVVDENILTGTIPDIFDKLPELSVINLHLNNFKGTVPKSIWDHESYFALILSGNYLSEDNMPDEFCSKATNLKIDDSSWFLNKPSVKCDCCDKPGCYVWETVAIGFQGPVIVRPPCPSSNTHKIYPFFEGYWVEDHISNSTLHEFHGPDNTFGAHVCLSPLGCYKIYDDEGGNLMYNLNYSESSRALSEQDACGAVDICGVSFEATHPKRKGLNHIAQMAISDMSKLDDPSSAEYQALCWVMTKDELYDDHEICDGTLLQRYVTVVSVFHAIMSGMFAPIDELASVPTCEWDSVTCDPDNIFVEEVNLSGTGLKGSVITEMGLLARLRKLDLSKNNLTGTIDPILFTQMHHLEEVLLSENEIGGEIPNEMVTLPQLKRLNVSGNLLVGELPKDVRYSKGLESFDVENNLLRGIIPSELIACKKLEVINLSRNGFIRFIPPMIGHMSNLRSLKLHNNLLIGNIPEDLFEATKIEELMLHSNSLTGSIPSLVGHLHNLTTLSLSRNSLKGRIPTEMTNLAKIEYIHLQQNFLTGTTPRVTLVDETENTAFISDCSTSLLVCESCTMCCNNEGKCQVQFKFNMKMEDFVYTIVLSLPIGIALLLFVMYQINKIGCLTWFKDNRSVQSIYNEDSVYCLVFSNSPIAWFLYLFTGSIQALAFYIFLRRSNFHDKETAWQFTYRCPGQGPTIDCIDEGTRNIFGWLMLSAALTFFLGGDFVDSIHQLRKAVTLRDKSLFVSGFVLFSLTVLAFFTSIIYNVALAKSNADLIINAVFLLFINDMDEQFLKLLDSLVPSWVAKRYREIKENMENKENSTKPPKSNGEESDGTNLLSATQRLLKSRFAGLEEMDEDQ